MSGLNSPQQLAVEYTDGPLLVLAGAGSGKTRVITEKIAHLIARRKHDAKHIAAITFTNKAAREMRERVAKRVKGDAAEGLTISTFHSLGLRFLQVEHARGEVAPRLLDLRQRRPDGHHQGPGAAGPEEGRAGSAARPGLARQERGPVAGSRPHDAARSARESEAAQLYERYQARLQAFNAVDFDDLIRMPLMLLEEDPGAGAGLARTDPLPAGGRVPGHQRRAVPPAAATWPVRAAR